MGKKAKKGKGGDAGDRKPDKPKGDGKSKGDAGKDKKKGKKEEKEEVKLTKKERRALKQKEIEAKQKAAENMMSQLVISESGSEEAGSGSASQEYDKFGNSVPKGRGASRRGGAASRGDGGGDREDQKKQGNTTKTTTGVRGLGGEEVADYLGEKEDQAKKLIEKQEAGGKLTKKEKKAVDAYLLRKARDDNSLYKNVEAEDRGLTMFSLTMEGAAATGDDADDMAVSATDVIVKGFSISAPKRELFVDATLRLAGGRRYGLLGPNGRGKSTLLRFIAARKLPVPAHIDVLLVEQEVAASDTSVVEQVMNSDKERLALLAEEQELDAAMGEAEANGSWSEEEWAVKLKRYTEVCDTLQAINADSAEGRARRILLGLGFTEKMMNNGSTILSGGWRMRVSLACALFIEPRLLLLDEPTNHLDLNAVLWLDEYLATKWKTTILCVSHDQDFLDNVCTDILNLENCKLKQYGAGIGRFRHMLAQQHEKDYKDWKQQEKEIKTACGKGNKNKGAVIEDYLRRKGIDELLLRPRLYDVNFNFSSPEDTRPSISVTNVSFSWEGAKEPLLKDLHFSVSCATRVAVVGPNGAGKSTLMNLITGKLEGTSGDIRRDPTLRMGRYDQHFDELLPMGLSGVEFLRKEYDVKEQEARQTLGRFGLDGARHLIPIGELSGGQKARVVFASLALQAPHVLLLDEPTNHLDMESVDALIEGINNFSGGVVLISHDARLISQTECDLWIVPGDQSLVNHKKGFEHYRAQLMKEIQDAEAEEEATNVAKAEQRRLDRENRLAKHSGRGKAREVEAARAAEEARKDVKTNPQSEAAQNLADEKAAEDAEAEKKTAQDKAKIQGLFGKKKKKDKKKDKKKV